MLTITKIITFKSIFDSHSGLLTLQSSSLSASEEKTAASAQWRTDTFLDLNLNKPKKQKRWSLIIKNDLPATKINGETEEVVSTYKNIPELKLTKLVSGTQNRIKPGCDDQSEQRRKSRVLTPLYVQ